MLATFIQLCTATWYLTVLDNEPTLGFPIYISHIEMMPRELQMVNLERALILR